MGDGWLGSLFFKHDCLLDQFQSRNALDWTVGLEERRKQWLCVLQQGNAQLLKQGLIRVHKQQHIRNDKLFRRPKKA
jgi:hypothetical protein